MASFSVSHFNAYGIQAVLYFHNLGARCGWFPTSGCQCCYFTRPIHFVFATRAARRTTMASLTLHPSVCTEVTRSGFINVPATAKQISSWSCSGNIPSSVALWRTSPSGLMDRAVWSCMALSFSQRAFNLTKHSGDRAPFLFQEPQGWAWPAVFQYPSSARGRACDYNAK
jgi:hypothetical protein